ncbi:hypothetical protein B0T17DRAFT_254801 [Bombardia bombarda]|uniref:Zn(2)-C6 fungal-type domain-containing protein n=1 Tax=Bombardia bombarda TaxID=252184 RepID=A0AA39X0Y0_9PEZI|nr:hypothetical protein B0T17DRAFT_254801 [Bombardia bombarda]
MTTHLTEDLQALPVSTPPETGTISWQNTDDTRYTDDQRRVIQHAADILGIPYQTLVSFPRLSQNVLPFPEITPTGTVVQIGNYGGAGTAEEPLYVTVAPAPATTGLLCATHAQSELRTPGESSGSSSDSRPSGQASDFLTPTNSGNDSGDPEEPHLHEPISVDFRTSTAALELSGLDFEWLDFGADNTGLGHVTESLAVSNDSGSLLQFPNDDSFALINNPNLAGNSLPCDSENLDVGRRGTSLQSNDISPDQTTQQATIPGHSWQDAIFGSDTIRDVGGHIGIGSDRANLPPHQSTHFTVHTADQDPPGRRFIGPLPNAGLDQYMGRSGDNDGVETPCSFVYQNRTGSEGSNESTFPAALSTNISFPAHNQHTTEPSSLRPLHRINQAGVQKNAPQKRTVRGPFKTTEERIETSKTRKIGACIRCVNQKLRCVRDPDDPEGECLTCRRVTGPRLLHYPCLRKKMTDTLYVPNKTNPGLCWTKRWKTMEIKEITEWGSSDIKSIMLTQDVGSVVWTIRVRRLVPQDGDSMSRSWLSRSSGARLYHPVAPYGVENMAETGRYLMRRIDEEIDDAINTYVQEEDVLLADTYKMARKYSVEVQSPEESQLLRDIFRLWAMARAQSKPERICGEETLGIEPQLQDPDRHDHGQVPVPPVISAQLTLIIETLIFKPLQLRIRKQMEKLM